MSKKKWAQEQIVDAAGKVHESVMARIDEKFPSQDAIISSHNENAIDIQCRLTEALAQIASLKGAMSAQDQRERNAGAMCGVSYSVHGCDWPDAVADEVLGLRAQIATLTEQVGWLQTDLTRGLNVEFQRTTCCVCGVYKHTPVRNDDLGGYICGGCLEKAYEKAEAELAAIREAIAWTPNALAGQKITTYQEEALRLVRVRMSGREHVGKDRPDLLYGLDVIVDFIKELASLREGATVIYTVTQADGFEVAFGFHELDRARAYEAQTPEGLRPAKLVEVITRERILDATKAKS